MKLEILEKDLYRVYINQMYLREVDFSEKESIAEYAKVIVFKLKKTYKVSLTGFYQMTIYVNDQVGMFVELQKLDDLDFDLVTIDLKVVIFLHQEFFLKTSDFDLIKGVSPLYYSHGFYYISFNDMKEVLPFLELGEIIYGEEVENVIAEGVCLSREEIQEY